MHRSVTLVFAALLASAAVAQTAPDAVDVPAAAKPKTKRVCHMRDSGNPMKPDRVCRTVPLEVQPEVTPVATAAPAPRADQVAQAAPAPHL